MITPGPLYKDDMDSSLRHALEVISGYYNLFLENEQLSHQWAAGSQEGGYICTNQGIRASIRILKAILDHLEQKDNVKVRVRSTGRLIEDIRKYLNPIIEHLASASPQTIKEFRQRYAEAGVQASTYTLLKLVSSKFPQFDPPGLKEYLLKTDTTNNQKAYLYLADIEKIIHSHVVIELKKKYGDGYSNWWHKGIKENIRNEAVQLATKDGLYDGGFEKYLYLINLKDIIENNWDILVRHIQ